MSALRWTVPYHGVQHLNPTLRGQATVTDYGTFAEAFVWAGPGSSLADCPEYVGGTVEEAKRWAETMAKGMGVAP